MADWESGKQLNNGEYSIQQKIGQGGFGATFLARDKKGNFVVIKTLSEEIQRHPYFDKIRVNFYNEAVRAAQCNHHPRIVKICKVIEENKLPCIVMEYISGESLSSKVENDGPLSESEALLYIQQIGEALIAIHSHNFLHRDIKPQNIIIRDDGSGAMLIDFGTAREFSFEAQPTTKTVFYTMGYSPIEQYDSQSAQGPYTDIYALAGTLYYLLTERIPPDSITRSHSLSTNKKDPLKVPTSIVSNLSEKVNLALMKGMAFLPEERPQTMKEFLEILLPGNLAPTNEISQKDRPEEPEPMRPVDSNSTPYRRFLLTGLFGVLALVASIIYFFFRSQDPPKFIPLQVQSLQNSRVEIKYPETWEIQREPVTNELTFISPKENPTDSFQESFTITEEDSDLDLSDYTDKTIGQIKANITPDITRFEKTTLAEKDAVKVIYQYEQKEIILKTMQVWTLTNNGTYYIFTYVAEEDKYTEFKKIIDKMLDSIEIN